MLPRNDLIPPSGSLKRVSAQLGFVVLGLAALFNLGALSVAERGFEQLEVSSNAVVQTQSITHAIKRSCSASAGNGHA